GFPVLIAQGILKLLPGNYKISLNFLRGYRNHFGHKEKPGQALVHRMELLRNMSHAFGMGTMGMGVEINIVKIGGTSHGHLAYKFALPMELDLGGRKIP